MVPLLDLKRQNEPLAAELVQAFERVLHSGQYILGKEVERLEQDGARIAGAAHGIGVSSGTDAILLALMALGVGPGDEVVCPSFTFFATAGCIARTGAKPVFADCCPVCFNLDGASLKAALTERTRAVIPVHLFGQAAHMDEILEIASAAGAAVIEDAAQALGASFRGRPAGSMGQFGTFSFFPSKNLGGFGDAGLLVANDAALADKARLLRAHGAKPKYFHRMVGGNFRMDPVQAALLSVKLPHLQEYCTRRAQNACAYATRLAAVAGGGAAHLILPETHDGNGHIWNQYTIRVAAGEKWNRPESPRDALKKFLQERQIGSEIYYPLPMHSQECFAYAGPHPSLPVSEQLARESLSIPVFPELTAEERETVVAAISDFLRQVN